MREQAPPLELTGLVPGPAQVRGAFRLVPLLRERPVEDVRIARWALEPGVRSLPRDDGAYVAFVPHGLRLSWGPALGAEIGKDKARWQEPSKLRKKDGRHALRFLPIHLALEGLLSVAFKPPAIGWPELSHSFQRFGLGHRVEEAYLGADIPGFDDALRTFEVHAGQVGLLVFAADVLHGAFVVPHPADYRELHRALLLDLYGELMYRHALFVAEAGVLEATPQFAGAASVADLRAGLLRMREEWAAFTRETMLGGLGGSSAAHRAGLPRGRDEPREVRHQPGTGAGQPHRRAADPRRRAALPGYVAVVGYPD